MKTDVCHIRRATPRALRVFFTAIFLTLLLAGTFVRGASGEQAPEGAGGSGKEGGAPLQPVVLQLKWHHQFQFAGYYAAAHMGFFREEGLAVTLKPGGPGIKVDREVTEGRADFGVLASELIRMRVSGEPLVLIAVIMQHSVRALIVGKDSEIHSPADLSDSPVMLNPNENVEFLAMFLGEGIPQERLLLIPKDRTALDRLVAGEVKAINGSIGNQPFALEKRGFPVRLIRPISYGVDFYGDSLFTTERKVKGAPEQVAAFRRASLRGWAWAMANPEKVIDLIISRHNPKKTREQLRFEAEALRRVILPDLVDLGHVNPSRIRRIADTYADHAILPAGYTLDGFIYDPDPAPDYSWLKQLLILFSAILLLALAAFVTLLLFNRQLRKKVDLRTVELSTANRSLAAEVLERTRAETALREHAEALERSNRELEQFAYVASHDLQEPLRMVASYVQLIERRYKGKLDQDADEFIAFAVDGATRMKALINDLLAFSRVGTRGKPFAPVDSAELMEKVMKNLGPAIAESGATVTTSALPEVTGDGTQLMQVLQNLVANGIKFRGKTAPEIRVTAGAEEANWHFTVRDNGIGIAEEFHERIFIIFQRLHGKEKYPGTGIGLAICKKIVERHGGRIWVESEQGEGAAFHFTLPQKMEEPHGS